MHSGTQISRVSFGNSGDQIGGPSQAQRGRKAADDRDDFPFQPEWPQGLINRAFVQTLSRDEDMPSGRITGRRDFTPGQRVPISRTMPGKPWLEHDLSVLGSAFGILMAHPDSRLLVNGHMQNA